MTAHLGRYLSGLDKKNFSVGLWRGDIVLENTDIKPAVLDLLQLPLVLEVGKIQRLVIKVPWSRLTSASVEIQISGVYMFLRDLDQNTWVYSEEEAVNRLKDRLETFEIARAAQQSERLLSPEEAQKGKSFTERLSAKVIDNLLVTIKDVHVCFEMTTGRRTAPCGIILRSLRCCTTNEHWNLEFLDRQSGPSPSKTIFKLVELTGLGVYFQTKPTIPTDSADMCSVLHELIEHPETLNFLLQPVDLEARVVHNTDFTDFSRPQFRVNVAVPRLEITYQQAQYRTTIEVLGLFAAYRRFLSQQ